MTIPLAGYSRIPVIAIGLALWNLATAQAGSSPSRYIRTAYGPNSGIPQFIVNSVAQSRQGFLWLAGGHNHLIRFDGQSFYVVPAPAANALAIAPNGDLWASQQQPARLIRIAAESLGEFGELPATSYSFDADEHVILYDLHFGRDGTLWLPTNRGLYRFDKGKLIAVVPGLDIGAVEETSAGRLLIISRGYSEWDGAHLIPHPEVAKELGIQPRQIFRVYEDRSGAIWYCTASGVARRVGQHMEKLQPWGDGQGIYGVYQDPGGTIWFRGARGVYRAVDHGLELADSEANTRSLFTDRDGQLWIGTNGNGLIRLRDAHVHTFTKANGLPSNSLMTVIVRADDTVWTGANCGGVSRFDGQHFRTYTEKDGLLNTCVFGLAEDAAHDLWIGTYGAGAFRFRDGVFTQFSTAQGVAGNVVTSVFASHDGSVWLATPLGAARISNGQVRNYPISEDPVRVSNFYQTRSGVLWAGSSAGLARLDNDAFHLVVATPPGAAPVGEDESGRIYVVDVATSGLCRLENDRMVNVDLPLGSANSVLEDHDGVEWFIGDELFGIARGALMRPRASDEPLDYRTIRRADGLARNDCGPGFPCAVLDHEGRLWVATLSGLSLVDLPRMPKTGLSPSIYLKDVTYGRTRLTPARELLLPAGATHIDLRFDAIELVSPEKIHLQYRMDGVDKEWLDAGPPGLATYSYIPPGMHRFHTRASNRDGIWDRAGVVFLVTQQPFFYETNPFRLSVLAVIGLMLFAWYRLRIRQIAAEMNARFDERLNERTRIARELHDTLLQTIQGSKLIADEALEDSADLPQVRRALVRLSGWLTQAAQEGRAALSALRASTLEDNDLADAFDRALGECRLQYSIECDLTVDGLSRKMHPIVRDEVYRIANEAIRNACVHSGCKHPRVELWYRKDLTVRVRDDGHGMDPASKTKSKESHFGILGMYERAAAIGAKLTITSSPSSGTEVELVVPGHIVYELKPEHITSKKRAHL